MKRFALAAVALQLSAFGALAQTSPTVTPGAGVTTNVPSETRRPGDGAVPTGVAVGGPIMNETEARAHLERDGYSGVAGLTKTGEGMWMGTAMKNGTSGRVAIDREGRVSWN